MRKFLVILLCLCLTACTKVTSTKTSSVSTEPFWTDDHVRDSNNLLNWNMLSLMDPESNQFFSSYGILSILLLLDAGAEGKTKTEIEEALGIHDLAAFIAAYDQLNGQIEKGCTNATAIYIDKSLPQAEDFQSYYLPAVSPLHASVSFVDFIKDTEKIKKAITKWVKEKTKGLIKDYQSQIDPESVADFLNVLYFDGHWKKPFLSKSTEKRTFYGKTQETKVDMMHIYDESFLYNTYGKFKIVELNYQEEGMVCDVIMPLDENDDLMTLWESLSSPEKENLLSCPKEETELHVLGLPKITEDITYDHLTEMLQKLGMTTMFSSEADFSHIAENLYVSSMIQRAKVKFDEKGTKAAAVTEASVKASAMRTDTVDFIADHPYLFVIRDTKTGLILFTGLINDLK